MAISGPVLGSASIEHAATGAVVMNPTSPATVSPAGSLLMLAVTLKPSTENVNTPSGDWEFVGFTQGGSTEPTRTVVYSKILTEDVPANTAFSINVGDAGSLELNVIARIMRFTKDAGEAWAAVNTGVDSVGIDNVHGTVYSVSFNTHVDYRPGDVSAIFSGVSHSSGADSNFARTIPGCTLINPTTAATNSFPTEGHWLQWRHDTSTVDSGTSTGAGTYSFNGTTGRSGTSVRARIRAFVPSDGDTLSMAESELQTISHVGSEDFGLAEEVPVLMGGLLDSEPFAAGEGQSVDRPVAFWSDSDDTLSMSESTDPDELLQSYVNEEPLHLHDTQDFDPEDDDDSFTMDEHQFTFLEEFTVEFNGSLTAPGFRIIIRGMLDSTGDFDEIDVIRRDPTGRYPDRRVRNLAGVPIWANNVEVIDYEAPLNVPLTYHARLHHIAGGTFEQGPVFATPQPYIPTLGDAYGGGTSFLTPIDVPEIGRAVMIEDMDSVQIPAEVMATHKVLNRRNKVIQTDVMGGNEGTFSGHAILHYGQTIDEIKRLFADGKTILIRNHNRTMSTFADFYFKVTGDIAYERKTLMTAHGELDNPLNPHVIVTFRVPFTEVDRPDPTGELILNNTWQDIKDNYATWQDVKDAFPTWLDVLKVSLNNPLEPES